MRRNWTEKEVMYLQRRYLYQPIEKTAKVLDRSKRSVKYKAYEIGLRHYMDNLNVSNIANAFHSHSRVVIRWINDLGLPAKKIVCNKRTRYIIKSEDFWKWAETHKGIINWSNYDLKTILPEPEWVTREKFTSNSRTNKRFTVQEKINIKNLLYRGMSYKQIAEETGRTYNSINHICRNIYL